MCVNQWIHDFYVVFSYLKPNIRFLSQANMVYAWNFHCLYLGLLITQNRQAGTVITKYYSQNTDIKILLYCFNET